MKGGGVHAYRAVLSALHLAVEQPEMIENEGSQKQKPINFMEWMSSNGVPDAIRGAVVAFLIALTILPFLGGRTIWSFGASPVSVPRAPESVFWLLVGLPPFLWAILLIRIIHAPVRRWLITLAGAAGVALISTTIHVLNPSIGLSSIGQNFNLNARMGFQEVGHSWLVAHEGDAYCHFVTDPIPLQLGRWCSLRIDRIEIEGAGRADVSRALDGAAAFDLEVFGSSSTMLPATSQCVDVHNFKKVKERPFNPEILGHTTIYVRQSSDTERYQLSDYRATFDFESSEVTAMPIIAPGAEIFRRDILHGGERASVQMSAWTLWGDPVQFQIDDLTIRVHGRRLCALGTE